MQRYEKGKNWISASRLQQISNVLQVPVPFFFEGLPGLPGASKGKVQAPSPAYVTDFVASSDGLSLIKAFMLIKRRDLRLAIVHLIEEIAARDHRYHYRPYPSDAAAASRPSTEYFLRLARSAASARARPRGMWFLEIHSQRQLLCFRQGCVPIRQQPN